MIGLRQARKHVGLDLGSRRLKVLWLEAGARGPRILRTHIVDLQEEGLLGEEEISRHLDEVLAGFGEFPVTVCVPQSLAWSQVLELPEVTGEEARRWIAEKTASLAGLSESAVIQDAIPLRPFGKFQNPYWIVLAREEAIEQQLARVGTAQDRVQHILTTAGGLTAAFQATQPGVAEAVLVELGATRTAVVLVEGGQPVFATHFATGSDHFTEVIRTARACSPEEAETLKRTINLISGEHQLPALRQAVEAWLEALHKTLAEWRRQHPSAGNAGPLRLYLSGAGAQQPGLVVFLRSKSGFLVETWPQKKVSESDLPPAEYVVAYGAAVAALHPERPHASLLPARLRVVQRQVRRLAVLNRVAAGALVLCALVLALGTWQRARVLDRKNQTIAQLQTALQHAREVDRLTRVRDRQLEQIAPVFERQKQTVDTLHTLHALQQARARHDFWFVLLGDLPTYLSGPRPGLATNPPSVTETNLVEHEPTQHGFVAEVCIPAPREEALKTLSELVDSLRKNPAFGNVDALAANLRRAWVDTNAMIADRTFALLLETTTNQLERVLAEIRAATNPPVRPAPAPRPRPRLRDATGGRLPETPAHAASALTTHGGGG